MLWNVTLEYKSDSKFGKVTGYKTTNHVEQKANEAEE